MIISALKERKNNEKRVALTPNGAQELINSNHSVLIEKSAGIGSGFKDSDYTEVGAKIISTPEDVYSQSDLIVKVKEPQPNEVALIRENQVVFTFFRFAADKQLTDGIINSKSIAIAYKL